MHFIKSKVQLPFEANSFNKKSLEKFFWKSKTFVRHIHCKLKRANTNLLLWTSLRKPLYVRRICLNGLQMRTSKPPILKQDKWPYWSTLSFATMVSSCCNLYTLPSESLKIKLSLTAISCLLIGFQYIRITMACLSKVLVP